MLGGKTTEEWIALYTRSHQHPINRICHTFGIPMIAISILLFLGAILLDLSWSLPIGLFIVGWILQFIGHWFEGKPPEFFHDWRFLLVGLRWWAAKMRGRG
jgi:uncharacterized membrane protein YGL010W